MVRALLLFGILSHFATGWTQNPIPATDHKDYDSFYWIHVTTDSGVVHAAVAVPKGIGPFPAVVILHGTHGFGQEYINIAKRLADSNIIGIAVCWFGGRKGSGERFITPIDFADAPPLVDVDGLDRFRIARLTIDTLLVEIRKLPQIKKDEVALFGHSRGGGAVLDYAVTHPAKVQAVILNSTGYPPEVLRRSSKLDVPILIIHGTADSPADGGSAFTDIRMAKQFETALKAANRNVEAKYYDGGGHNSLFSNSSQFNDTCQQIVKFIRDKFFK